MRREPEPLVTRLARQPGMKEPRYIHLLGGPVEAAAAPPPPHSHTYTETVEEQIESLRREVSELREEFTRFRRQFEAS